MWRDVFSLSFETLCTNKPRTALTLTSVAIGVASILFCVSVGESIAKFIQSEMSSLGTDLMWVSPDTQAANPGQRVEPLTYEDAVTLSEIPGIKQVGPRASRQVVLRFDQVHVSGQVMGVNPGYFLMRNKKIGLGRALVNTDLELKRRVCVIGPAMVERLMYKTPEPVGQIIKVDDQSFIVIGVVAKADSNLKTPGLEEENTVFIPLTTGIRLFGLKQLDLLFFQPDGTESRDMLRQRIMQVLLLRKGARVGYLVDSLDEKMAQIENLVWVVVAVFASIAGVSLLVAGIGIMNIMLLSVMERTREIGIRKSVGARRNHIRNQFFIEAILLSTAGAGCGIIFGFLGVVGVSSLIGGVLTMSWKGIFIAVFFAVLTGVGFGLYPAERASRLDPIIALTREMT